MELENKKSYTWRVVLRGGRPVNLNSFLKLRVPREVVNILDRHARHQLTTASGYTRIAIVEKLRRDGVCTPTIDSRMKFRVEEATLT
jgi:hypothetical protein